MSDSAAIGSPAGHFTAAALREQFDRTFAEPPPLPRTDTRDFVLVQVSGLHCALPARQLLGIENGTRVVPVPSSVPSLLGVAGVGGAVVPVFHLGRLLAAPDTSPNDSSLYTFACVALSSAPDSPSLGLCFDELLAFARVDSGAFFAAPAEHSSRTLRFEQALFRELDLPSIVQTLTRNAPAPQPAEGSPA